MEKLIKQKVSVILIMLIVSMVAAFAQVSSLPSPVGNLYKQGTNSTGPAATEDPDYITKGTKVLYLVVPDPDINPGWAAEVTSGGDAKTTTGIAATTSWLWTIPAGVNSTFVPASNVGHFIFLDITGDASATIQQIKAKEKNATACPGSETTINVRIIDPATATGLTIPSATECTTTGTAGSLNVVVPTYTLAYSSDAPNTKKIKVIASLTYTPFGTSPTTSDIFTDQELDVANSGVITVPSSLVDDYDDWGTYTLTITKISDKISRKDMDTARKGYFDASQSVEFTVYKTPVTGSMYHLPND